jgi:ribosomal-protein-alanine N-acetyltransferase
LAIDVASALIEYAFVVVDLDWLIGQTASGNRRIERLARWFGAEIAARRDGPDWMAARGWVEVDWALHRHAWMRSRHRERLATRGAGRLPPTP